MFKSSNLVKIIATLPYRLSLRWKAGQFYGDRALIITIFGIQIVEIFTLDIIDEGLPSI